MTVILVILTIIAYIIGIYSIIKKNNKIFSVISLTIGTASLIAAIIVSPKPINPPETTKLTSDVQSSEPSGNSFDSAIKIALNTEIEANCNGLDELYYAFDITDKSSLQLIIKHNLIEDYTTFCEISLYESNQSDCFMKESLDANVSTHTLQKLRKDSGTYYLVFSPRMEDISFSFSVNTSIEGNEYEKENNNELLQADNIELNHTKIGNTENQDDVDYYTFSLDNSNKVSITFTHPIYDSDSDYWKVELFDEDSTTRLINMHISGSSKETTSDKVLLTPQEEKNYYIKISSYTNLSTDDYKIRVNAKKLETTTNQGIEMEPNNDVKTATKIKVNSLMIGNSQSSDDTDYYKFSLSSPGEAIFSFSHAFIDDSSSYWKITLISENAKLDDQWFYIDGDQSTFSSDKLRLPVGVYYIKIEPYSYYVNDDYKIKLTFKSY